MGLARDCRVIAAALQHDRHPLPPDCLAIATLLPPDHSFQSPSRQGGFGAINPSPVPNGSHFPPVTDASLVTDFSAGGEVPYGAPASSPGFAPAGRVTWNGSAFAFRPRAGLFTGVPPGGES